MTNNDMEVDDMSTQQIVHESSSEIEIESESEPTSPKLIISATNTDQDASKSKSGALHTDSVLPLVRIRKIMKADPELSKCTPESVLAAAISTELFVEWLAETAAEITKADNRKTLRYEDIAQAVSKDERISFLSELIPTPITIKEAMERRKVADSKGKIGNTKGNDNDMEETVHIKTSTTNFLNQ